MATKILRKELRRPDEFVTATNRVLHYVQEHQRLSAWLAGGAIAVVIAVIAVVSFRHTRMEQANTNLARAISLFNENKLPEAIKAFDEMAGQTSNPEEFVEIARLYSAQAQLKLGEFARAGAGFDGVEGGLEGFLAQRALLNHAFALEGNQQFEDAARHFSQAASAGGPYTAIAVLGEARNWDRLGDKPKAKEAYQKYASQFPDAPEKAVVESRLAILSQ